MTKREEALTDRCAALISQRALNLDEIERLKARVAELEGLVVRRHDTLSAEHARVCNEHALLVQESGREGRALDWLEGLLRAWGEADHAWEAGDDQAAAKAKYAVYAEAVRLAKEKP